MYASVASERPCHFTGSVSSNSIPHRSSIGLNRKYFAPGTSGRSVRSESSTRSTSQLLSISTFLSVMSDSDDASRVFGATFPLLMLTRTSMGLSGHSLLASMMPNTLGLLHVTAPSCHFSSPREKSAR